MSELEINRFYEWTEEDRLRGECPVPAGADVTVMFSDGEYDRDSCPGLWNWSENKPSGVTGYIIHALPKPEPLRLWVNVYDSNVVGYSSKGEARQNSAPSATRVAVPMIEVMEDDE